MSAARGAVVALAAATALALAGCTSDAGAPELRDAADQGFVAGDGSITVLDSGDRDAPVQLSGETLTGDSLDVADLRGQAVVVNVWGSWCGPCRAEAPDLVAAHDRLTGDDPDRVSFVGINVRDASTTNAVRFEEQFGIPYPSWHDPDGDLLLNLRGQIPPQAIPSTLVLDGDGSVAARVLGQVDEGTLVGLVQDVLAEQDGAAAGGHAADAGGA